MLTVPSVGRNPEYLELPSSAVRQEDVHITFKSRLRVFNKVKLNCVIWSKTKAQTSRQKCSGHLHS